MSNTVLHHWATKRRQTGVAHTRKNGFGCVQTLPNPDGHKKTQLQKAGFSCVESVFCECIAGLPHPRGLLTRHRVDTIEVGPPPFEQGPVLQISQF